MERDPRINPQKGDVLRRGRRVTKAGYNTYTAVTTRTVIHREVGNGNTYMANRVQVRDNNNFKRPSLKQFREWAKNAEVIHRAAD